MTDTQKMIAIAGSKRSMSPDARMIKASDPGQQIDLSGPTVPTGTSNANWTGAAWNQINVVLVGFSPTEFYGWN